jgi:hypothetical protein
VARQQLTHAPLQLGDLLVILSDLQSDMRRGRQVAVLRRLELQLAQVGAVDLEQMLKVRAFGRGHRYHSIVFASAALPYGV